MMPQVKLHPPHDIALGALENTEYKSLSWGYVDGSFTEGEAEAVISSALLAADIEADAGDILDDLVETKLVRTWHQSGRRYRTRFADLVRLLVRSRQLFANRPWRTAPTLVSDFRVDVRERTTPRIQISAAKALEELDGGVQLSPLQKAVWIVASQANQGFGLRRFQSEAARRLLNNTSESGTIITAGTGSGKTLAFYLPALVAMSDGLVRQHNWTRALCIYPRQELLKDQLSEAHRMCLRTVAALRDGGRRSFTLGALYGGTPHNASGLSLEQARWKRTASGYICPFLRCPTCSSEMQWKDSHLDQKIEKLSCVSAECGAETASECIRLTRSSIRLNPPDFLFTTTEMLNRRLSDTDMRHVFGVGPARERRPIFVLLDEVHTYSGTSGAQAALLLRRWRHLADAPVRWVGLSATLRQAPAFFADLTGLRPDAIAEISPGLDDMEFWGAEYQLLLRTDPASQAATLSTSIQAAMLAARMLDPTAEGPSEGRFGRRLFAFTDDLDVTHRLYDNLRDAEAYDRFGRADPTRRPLAALRSGREPEPNEREADGQRWSGAEDLRGSLENRLVIGRTTSRDPGVDGRADVIVATAALEVGFNDTEVGAVLQHKAPRTSAAFLQRRGRAGRRDRMRPVTITVLSDYGRDRIAYQSYEHLFDPVVERQVLPTRNAYVLHMQAVFSLFDWLCSRIASNGGRGWAWDALSRPPDPRYADRGFRSHAKELIEALADLKDATVADLSQHLQSALGLTPVELRTVLWDPPRPLLLEAVPTLARRLCRDWKLAGREGLDIAIDYHPLPDFVPGALYEDLNLPEVVIEVPAATVRSEGKEESMPILQALSQFAPGRVRRRFADEYAGLAHWIPVDPTHAAVEIPISDYSIRREFVGTFRGWVSGAEQELVVYRPWRMRVAKPPGNILPTSHGAWHWQSGFEFLGEPLTVEMPGRSAWALVISHLDFFLHRFSSAVSQRRFAAEGTAEVRQRQGSSYVRYQLVGEDGAAAAVGFAFESDALRVALRFPSRTDLASREIPDTLRRWLRTLHMRSCFATDPMLPEDINRFQRDWLFHIFLLTAVRQAEVNGTTLHESILALSTEPTTTPYRWAVAALLSAEAIDEEDEDAGDHSKLAQTLDQILRRPGIIARLAELACQTILISEDAWGEWLLIVLRDTLSEALLQSCLIAAPANTAVEGLTVDLVTTDGDPHVIVAESTLGGGGTIEALAHSFSSDPPAFLRALDAALAPTDLEMTADALEQVIILASRIPEIAASLEAMRSAQTQNERITVRDKLYRTLAANGVPVSHTLSVSIATRLLRPGASSETDSLIRDMLKHWRATEQRHQIALPVRLASAICASDLQLKDRLNLAGSSRGSEIGMANLLLWPRGGEIRFGGLQSYNPFRAAALTDTALARSLLVENSVPTFQLIDPDWRQRVAEALAQSGQARVTTDASGVHEIRAEVVKLFGEPITTNYLRLYPMLAAVRPLPNGGIAFELSLRERF